MLLQIVRTLSTKSTVAKEPHQTMHHQSMASIKYGSKAISQNNFKQFKVLPKKLILTSPKTTCIEANMTFYKALPI